MGIDTDHYISILNAFQEKIWHDEFTDEQQMQTAGKYEGIWDIVGKGRKDENFFKLYFSNNYPETARNHFIRKIDDYEGRPLTPIKPEFLEPMLKVIGVEYPIGTTERSINTARKRATLLYEEFKKAFDPSTDKIPEENNLKDNIESKDELLTEISDEEIQEFITVRQVSKLVSQYFQYITTKDYKSAFDSWHPQVRLRRFGDDMTFFSQQFLSTDLIELHSIASETTFTYSQSSIFISYNVELCSFSSDEMEEFLSNDYGSLKVGDFLTFTKTLKKLIDKTFQNDIIITDKTIWSLKDYSLIEWIHLQTANNLEKLKTIFPDQRLVKFTRFARVAFYKDEETNYYLTDFQDLATSDIKITGYI